jgi:hypothetical protein
VLAGTPLVTYLSGTINRLMAGHFEGRRTIFAGKRGAGPTDIRISGTLMSPSRTGWEPPLDRFGWWALAAVLLIHHRVWAVLRLGPFLAPDFARLQGF